MYLEHHHQASILFGDLVGFTNLSAQCTARQLVSALNSVFGEFDKLAAKNNCEKIKVLGDCYYCVSGVTLPRKDHADCILRMGLDMIEALKQFEGILPAPVKMRIGVHTGSVISGVLGTKKYQFDIWSKAVTIANTLESTGTPGFIHASRACMDCLQSPLEAGVTAVPRPYASGEAPHPALQGMQTFLLSRTRRDERPPSVSVAEDKISTAFRAFDRESSGVISKASMREVLVKLNHDVDQLDLDAMFDDADVNGDGLLDFNEFRSALQRQRDIESTFREEVSACLLVCCVLIVRAFSTRIHSHPHDIAL